MWELGYKESWAPKNWCIWTVVSEKTLESFLDYQSILKEISPGCSLEGLMLKLNSNILATWCEELTRLKRPWCWERLKAGGEEDDRKRWLDGITNSMDMSLASSESWWWTRKHGVLQSRGLQRGRHDWATELIPDCSVFIYNLFIVFFAYS